MPSKCFLEHFLRFGRSTITVVLKENIDESTYFLTLTVKMDGLDKEIIHLFNCEHLRSTS